MPEPISNTVAVGVVAVGAPAAAALFSVWPFGIAFAAGCVALIYLAEMSIKKTIKSIVGSTLIGGSLAQLFSIPILAVGKSIYPAIAPWAETAQFPMTAILAILIGLSAQKLMPKLLDRAGREIDRDTKAES